MQVSEAIALECDDDVERGTVRTSAGKLAILRFFVEFPEPIQENY
jgi:hypothetical protein